MIPSSAKKIVLHLPAKQVVFSGKQWKTILAGMERLRYKNTVIGTDAEKITQVFQEIKDGIIEQFPF